MPKDIKTILKENANWAIRKIDFDSQEIKMSLAWVQGKKEEAEQRKEIDPSKLKLVVKL